MKRCEQCTLPAMPGERYCSNHRRYALARMAADGFLAPRPARRPESQPEPRRDTEDSNNVRPRGSYNAIRRWRISTEH